MFKSNAPGALIFLLFDIKYSGFDCYYLYRGANFLEGHDTPTLLGVRGWEVHQKVLFFLFLEPALAENPPLATGFGSTGSYL